MHINFADSLGGRVLDLDVMALYSQSEFVAIDKQPNDNVVHLDRCGKADRLTRQPLDPRASCQMFPRNLLGVALARLVRIRCEMTCVGTPIVGVIPYDPKRLQQRL